MHDIKLTTVTLIGTTLSGYACPNTRVNTANVKGLSTNIQLS